MAEKWRRYETLMIFDPELGTEATEELIQRVRDFVTQESGRIVKSERWGVRELAFELKGRLKGYYLLLEYAGPARAATELERRLNLLDTVLKHQTLKLEDAVDPESLPEEEEIPAPEGESAEGAASEETESSEAPSSEPEAEEEPAGTPDEGSDESEEKS